jgi:formate hydrogenlyase subunit 4
MMAADGGVLGIGPIGAVGIALAQVLVMVVLSPVVIGVSRQMRARLEGRAGAGIGQPWRDLRKLLAKEPISAEGTSWVLPAAPVIVLGSGLMVCALLPLFAVGAVPHLPGDLFVVVSFLLVGSIALALLGLDSGTAFGGMGSSRHMTIAALVEPTVLLAVYALSIPVHSSALSLIVAARLQSPVGIISPLGLLAVVSLIIVVLAETGRLPVDNPSTHLELTMVHEAMVLESSGRDLAWLELGSWVRLSALLGLIANLLAPWGVATTTGPLTLTLAVLALIAKVLILSAALGTAEVFLAKLRLFRVPELLAGSFALAFLAVTATYLVS